MLWKIEQVDEGRVSGWVYDPARPELRLEVLALSGNEIIGRTTATQHCPALAEQTPHAAERGFTLALDTTDSLTQVICVSSDDPTLALVLHSANSGEIGKNRRAYQSFRDYGGKGASDSAKKLDSLLLPPFNGKSVLDLGCNEGFFSHQALLGGAAKVLGMDSSSWFIERARARVKGYDRLAALGKLEFRRASWWEAPDEKFDLILLLSAIHYEKEQRTLLDFLAARLTPRGMLVLECGSINEPGKHWLNIRRSIDVCRFPTDELLRETLLQKYAVRKIGDSIAQEGDPVPRSVYHCALKKNVAGIIRGASGTGKTVLAGLLGRRNVPCFSSDLFFESRLSVFKDFNPDTPLYNEVISGLSRHDLGAATDKILSIGAEEEFCNDFIACLPLEEELFLIEGEIFRNEKIYRLLTLNLKRQGIRVWDITPG